MTWFRTPQIQSRKFVLISPDCCKKAVSIFKRYSLIFYAMKTPSIYGKIKTKKKYSDGKYRRKTSCIHFQSWRFNGFSLKTSFLTVYNQKKKKLSPPGCSIPCCVPKINPVHYMLCSIFDAKKIMICE